MAGPKVKRDRVLSPGTLWNPNSEKLRVKKVCKVAEVGITPMYLPIAKIYDGDTIHTFISLPAPLNKVSIRIRHIDTPESTRRAKCDYEQERGKAATNFLKEFVGSAGLMTVTNYKWDKYGKRIDGDVEIKGVDIGQMLIDNGFAQPYEGVGPKPNWGCKVPPSKELR